MTEKNIDQKSFNETFWTRRGAEEIRRRQLRNLKSESTQTETQSLAQICAQISPKLALKFVIILICILSCILLFLWRIFLSEYVNAAIQNAAIQNAQNEKFENLKSKMTECQNQNDYLRRSYDVSDLLLKEKLHEFDDMKLQIHECRNYHDYLQYAKIAGVLLICFTLLLLGITCIHQRQPGRHSPVKIKAKATRLSIQWITDILQAMWCNTTYIWRLCNKIRKLIKKIVKNHSCYPDNSFLLVSL